VLRARRQLFLGKNGQGAHVTEHLTQMAYGLYDVAAAGFAFGTDHCRAFTDTPQCFAEIPATTHEGRTISVLVNVMGLVGRGQHFALIDEVDAKGFKHTGFGEVSDTDLGHYRNRNHLLDALDDLDGAHAGDAAFLADIRWHALQRHDCRGAGVLGDFRLRRGGDIHDDAALEHLGESHFNFE
jgi:hypothetical protein